MMYYSATLEIILIIIFGLSCYAMGWHCHKGKCEREKKAEDSRIEITNAIEERSSNAL